MLLDYVIRYFIQFDLKFILDITSRYAVLKKKKSISNVRLTRDTARNIYFWDYLRLRDDLIQKQWK